MFVEIRFQVNDLARLAHPGRKGHRIVAFLKFQFDESYNDRAMCVGGWLASELEWLKFERMWTKRLKYINSRNAPNQQITRFHAAPLNARDDEFKNWTQDMSIAFSKKFLSTIQKRDMRAICMSTDMQALHQAFPDGDPKAIQERGYILCIKQMMVEIGHTMRDHYPNDKVLLVHDRGNWDVQALNAYHWMVDDVRWEPRKYFAGIIPMSWEHSIGLQPADMVAYETFRFLKDTVLPDTEKLRSALIAMMERRLEINSKYMNARALNILSGMVAARLGDV